MLGKKREKRENKARKKRGKREEKERKKREKKRIKKRRKKEREERDHQLNTQVSLFGATCIRGDLVASWTPLGRFGIDFGGFQGGFGRGLDGVRTPK